MQSTETRIKGRSAALHIVVMSAGVFELSPDAAGNIQLTLKQVSAPTLEVMFHDPGKVKPEELEGQILSARGAVMMLQETIRHLETQLKKSGDGGMQIEEIDEAPSPGERN